MLNISIAFIVDLLFLRQTFKEEQLPMNSLDTQLKQHNVHVSPFHIYKLPHHGGLFKSTVVRLNY